MYYYEYYQKFQDEYIPGVKKIKLKTFCPIISIDIEPFIRIKKTSHSYVSYFNKKGKLIHVINLRAPYKYSYTYNILGKLNRIVEMDKYSNYLTAENRIEMINRVDFEEKITVFRYDFFSKREFIIHEFFENEYKVSKKAIDSDDDYVYIEIEEPEYHRKEKIMQDQEEIIFWDSVEYNERGQEVMCYALDKNGHHNQNNYSMTTYLENGLEKSCTYIGMNGFTKKREYEYDEKGNWIHQTLFKDDIPQYIYERELEYY